MTGSVSDDPVLFVSHDARQTGAPAVLLHVLRWIRAKNALPFEVVLAADGPLRSDFETLGTVHSGYPRPRRPPRVPGVRRFSRLLGLERPQRWGVCGPLKDAHSLCKAIRPDRFRLIYSNTIVNGELVDSLWQPPTPVITHVHELDSWLDRAGAANWAQVRRHTSCFVAVADAVKAMLIERGVPESKISLIPECAEPPPLRADDIRESIREQLGIPANSLVVCGGGAEVWRKGRDLFLQLAMACRRMLSPKEAHFVWIGADADVESSRWLHLDATRGGCDAHVHWVGHVTNPQDYLAAADVFAMTSREDPRPLVAIESGMLGVPVVCFENAGGTGDWVGNECGRTVPFLDVAAMASAVCALLRDAQLRESLGRQARLTARTMHSVEVVAPQILSVIRTVLADRVATSQSDAVI